MKSLSGVSKLAVLLLILVLPAVATAPTINAGHPYGRSSGTR